MIAQRYIVNARVAALAVFLTAVLSHIGSLKNEYVMDDFSVVALNEYATQWDNFKQIISPSSMLSSVIPVRTGTRMTTLFTWVIDSTVYANREQGYHLTNILLHGVNSALVSILVLILLKSSGMKADAKDGFTSGRPIPSASNYIASILSGMIFAMHPVQAEAVNVISYRADLLASMFYCVSLIVAVKAVQGYRWLYLLLLPLMVLGLLSKEIMISFPAALLAVLILFGGRSRKKADIIVVIGISIVVIFFVTAFWLKKFKYPVHDVIFTSISANVSPLSSIAAYCNTVLMTVIHYAKTFTAPFHLSAEYQLDLPGTFFGLRQLLAFGIIGLYIGCFIIAKSSVVRTGLGLFALAYLPVSNVVPLLNTVADRYMYLPMIGISVAVGGVLAQTALKNSYKLAIVVLISLVLGIATVNRGSDYRDMMSIYTKAVKIAPNNARARYNLGLAYFEKEDFRRALEEFKKAAELNPYLKKDNTLVYIGRCHEQLGKLREAKDIYRQAVLIRPDQGLYKALANICWQEADYDGAEKYLLSAVALSPDSSIYNNLGTMHAKRRDYLKAAIYYRKALDLNPGYTDAWLNLMDAYELAGKHDLMERTKDEMVRVYENNGWEISGSPEYDQ